MTIKTHRDVFLFTSRGKFISLVMQINFPRDVISPTSGMDF